MYYIIIIISFVVTVASQIFISVTYKKYRKNICSSSLTGVEVALKLLKENDLENIYVIETKGELTDHYDPNNKVIRLSTEVFNGENISSCAVAAHEVGHAIQYKQGNKFIKIRSLLVPFVNFCSKLGYIAIVISLISGILDLLYLGVFLLFSILIFELVTLPVEFGASKIGLENLKKYNILKDDELVFAKKVLTAAALTYVASLVTTILEIFRLLLMANDRD